jgi:glycosyltransferase involved in cell wall biosynthesis
MLQALVDVHDVTVLTWWPVDVNPINRFFGTTLRPETFRCMTVPTAWRFVPDSLPVPAALLRSALLMRYTRRVTKDFEVVVGVHNETDYGRRGIQYVHYPAYLRPRPDVDLRWYHAFKPLLHTYYGFADALAGLSMARVRENVTLANSNWTAAHIKRFLGIDAQTLYPPVAATIESQPWTERRRGFLAMGRLSPEKAYDRVLRIIARVRQTIPDVTLTIVGTWDRATEGYYRQLADLAARFDPMHAWVSFRRDLSRDAVRELIAGNRYGIHGMREEHFGMAPAEMVYGGMIVWVANGGGQVEIVGDAADLRYDSEDDAVAKIVRVLRDDALQADLRAHLAARRDAFSVEHFVSEVRRVVAEF